MSLIITSSNKAGETNQNQIDAPYHYRNDFRSGMKIPANSEIAVESVKINRNPALDYEESQVTLFWFGERLAVSGSLEESMSWVIPSINRISRNLSPEDFKENFEPMLKRALSVHPEIDTVNGITMTPIHATSSVVNPFQGFRYNINQIGESATSAVPPSGYEHLIYGDVSYDGTTITADDDDTYVQLQPVDDVGGPISLFDGELTFTNFTGPNWTVGLSRPIYNAARQVGFRADFVTPNPTLKYFTHFSGEGLGADGDQFYDYAVESYNGEIKLYHVVPSQSQRDKIEMREINYYQKNNTAIAANNASNSSFATGTPIPSASITDITFKVENEIVEISASGNVIVRCNNISSASFKDQVPKPVNQNCWKMYPTVGLWTTGDDVDVTVYRCRTSSTMDKNILPNNWAFKTLIHADMDRVFEDAVDTNTSEYVINDPWNNAGNWSISLDQRPLMKRFIDIFGDTSSPLLSDYVRPYKGLNASRMEGYEPLLIVGKSERYTDNNIQEWQPNSMNVLGFAPFAVAPLEDSVTDNTGQASFTSTTRPSMTSEHSTFIRVPTLNHKTFNFGTGNPSKILFHIPRFDNSGAETGALFFQNQDKSFIDLNNTSDITVTDLDVHFVRKDETFAKDLSGSSEVIFFVRQKSKM